MKKSICVNILLLGISLLLVNTSYGIEGVPERKIIKIGIIPVVNKPMDLRNYKQCFIKWKYKKYNNTGNEKILDGYEASVVLHKDASCAPVLPAGSQKIVLDVKEVLLSKIFYGGSDPVNLTNVHFFNTEHDKFGDINLYPLSMVGDYWNKQLRENGIVKTAIGDNIHLVIAVEDSVVSTASFLNQVQFTKYLDKAFDSSGISKSKYDFTVMAYLSYPCNNNYPKKDQPGCHETTASGSRGTASGVLKRVYAEYNFSRVPTNMLFETIIHELGHLLFNLNDTYVEAIGGVKYPAGVVSVDKSVLSNAKTICLMSERLPNNGNEPYKNAKTKNYQMDTIPRDRLSQYGLPPFFLDNPYANVLCPYDLSIMNNSIFNGDKMYSTIALKKTETNSEEKPSCDSQDVNEDVGEIDLGIRFVKKNVFPIDSETTGNIVYSIYARNFEAKEGVDYSFGGYTLSRPLTITLDRNKAYDIPLTQKLKIIDRPGKQTNKRRVLIQYSKPGIDKVEITDKGCVFFNIIDND